MLRRAGQDDELAYSPERKAAFLAKMLPANNMPLGRLSEEEGISVETLTKWQAEARAKGQFLPDAKAGPEGWTSEDKLAAVIETASLNEAELGEYCRRRGIYAEQLAVWREACARANDWERSASRQIAPKTRDANKRVQQLERELARKEKAPQTNGMVERFNGRIEEVQHSHNYRSGEELAKTLHQSILLFKQPLPQSYLCSKMPFQTMRGRLLV